MNLNYKEIYENSFNNPNYNLHEDNEFRFQIVIGFIEKNKVDSLIDIGSGRGNVINLIKKNFPQIKITSTDLIKFHDFDVPFFEIDLCQKKSLERIEDKKFTLLSCLDVMEHINRDCVDDVLDFFSRISDYSILTIANHSDVLNGVELHLIQEDMSYWKPKIENKFHIIDYSEEYNGRLHLLTLKSKN